MEALLKLKSVLCDPEGLVCVVGSDADREIIQSALAELADQLAAARAEIERLQDINSKLCEKSNRCIVSTARLEEQLAAAQAKNVGLRDALKEVQMVAESSVKTHGYDKQHVRNANVAKRAISAPSDTSALASYVVKAGEKMRERVIDECFRLGILSSDGRFMREIRAIPGVTLEDLK